MKLIRYWPQSLFREGERGLRLIMSYPSRSVSVCVNRVKRTRLVALLCICMYVCVCIVVLSEL